MRAMIRIVWDEIRNRAVLFGAGCGVVLALVNGPWYWVLWGALAYIAVALISYLFLPARYTLDPKTKNLYKKLGVEVKGRPIDVPFEKWRW